MSDSGSIFLLEDICLREKNYEDDIMEANKKLQQERAEKKQKVVWQQGADTEGEDAQFLNNNE